MSKISAFFDELEKLAMNMVDAKKAVDAFKSEGKLIRRGISPSMEAGVGGGGMSVAFNPGRNGQTMAVANRINTPKQYFPEGSEAAVSAMAEKVKTNVGGKIFQSKGGVVKGMQQALSWHPENGIKEIVAKMSPQEKEMTNRIGIIHEGHELAVTRKAGLPFGAHMSPNVIAKENNAITSLPEGFDNVKAFYNRAREIEGTKQQFGNIPYGSGRMSKPYVNDKLTRYKNEMDRIRGLKSE